MPDTATIQVSGPAEFLSTIPSLTGFVPQNSVVIAGLRGHRHQVAVTLRYDVDADPASIADHAVGLLERNQLAAACAAIYGPANLADPAAAALLTRLDDAGIILTEVLRVQDGRYWSYMCRNLDCCPPEGTPFTVTTPPALGDKPVLVGRGDLAARIAPAPQQELDTMAAAIARSLPRNCSRPAGRDENTAVIAAARDGAEPSDEAVAGLLGRLTDLALRDDAWARMDPAHAEDHLRLWTRVVRLAPAGYVAAPASLLAFVAWQSGNGALANVALDRALADDPRYSMATLLREVITGGGPPALARLPMTPEEVAASYADADAG